MGMNFSQLKMLFAISLSIGLVVVEKVWAHGENQPGPHGGTIRMPGAYHTELLIESPQRLKVYLLDVEFANPVTENSEVQVRWIGKGQSESGKCQKGKDVFICDFSSKVNLKQGTRLEVNSTRKGAKGNLAVYPLMDTDQQKARVVPAEASPKDSGHHHH